MKDDSKTSGLRKALQDQIFSAPEAAFNDADVAFVRAMIPHHEAAVAMAADVLSKGKNPQTKRLAMNIHATQRAEIEWMRGWLKARGLTENAGGKKSSGGKMKM